MTAHQKQQLIKKGCNYVVIYMLQPIKKQNYLHKTHVNSHSLLSHLLKVFGAENFKVAFSTKPTLKSNIRSNVYQTFAPSNQFSSSDYFSNN